MNEYQDQAVWFEVQRRQGGRWVPVADADTRDDANDKRRTFEADKPEGWFRVRRVTGLASDF